MDQELPLFCDLMVIDYCMSNKSYISDIILAIVNSHAFILGGFEALGLCLAYMLLSTLIW